MIIKENLNFNFEYLLKKHIGYIYSVSCWPTFLFASLVVCLHCFYSQREKRANEREWSKSLPFIFPFNWTFCFASTSWMRLLFNNHSLCWHVMSLLLLLSSCPHTITHSFLFNIQLSFAHIPDLVCSVHVRLMLLQMMMNVHVTTIHSLRWIYNEWSSSLWSPVTIEYHWPIHIGNRTIHYFLRTLIESQDLLSKWKLLSSSFRTEEKWRHNQT